MPDRKWAKDEDRQYYGSDGVITTTGGELRPADPVISFNWGYHGSGPNSVAHAILTDALGWEPSPELRIAFVADFVAHFPDEFRIRRPAILRWVRGWACQQGLHDLRAPLDVLPPVDRTEYERRPSGSTG